MAEYAGEHPLEVWYLGVDSATLEDVLARADIDAEQRRLARKRIRKARAKDNLKAFRRLTTTVNGTLQSLFAILVLVVVANAFVIWVRAVRAGGLPTTEVPWHESHLI